MLFWKWKGNYNHTKTEKERQREKSCEKVENKINFWRIDRSLEQWQIGWMEEKSWGTSNWISFRKRVINSLRSWCIRRTINHFAWFHYGRRFSEMRNIMIFYIAVKNIHTAAEGKKISVHQITVSLGKGVFQFLFRIH